MKKIHILMRLIVMMLCFAVVLGGIGIGVFAEETDPVPEGPKWDDLLTEISEAPNGSTVTLYADYKGDDSADRILIETGREITIDLNGHTIDRNLTHVPEEVGGHVIAVQLGATLTIKDSSGNNSGVIRGGYARNGGGINNSGTLIIEGGTITGNIAETSGDNNGRGGGICNYGKLTITGGVITKNYAYAGGGIGIRSDVDAEDCIVNISGAVIYNNEATEGGAISTAVGVLDGMDLPVTVDLNNVEIKDNVATGSGGALRLWGGTVTVGSGTVIRGNITKYGGAAYVEEKGVLNLYGGRITENDASGQGGAVLLSQKGGKVNIQGNPVVTLNTSAKGDNIYLRPDTVLTVTGALGSDASIGVTLENVFGKVTEGFSSYNPESAISCFVPDADGYVAGFYENEVEINRAITYVERSWDGSNVVSEKKTWTGHIEPLQSHVGNMIISGGVYYVENNVFISGALLFTSDTDLIICDGAILTVSGIHSQGYLNIYGQDKESGKIQSTGLNGNSGIGGPQDYPSGRINIHGGNITAVGGTNGAGIGGGNHNSGYAGINIYGGTILVAGGSSGAGIGKGQQNPDSKCGVIRIYGGNITATGGHYSAGIGGGEDCNSGEIQIWGGTVKATGTGSGAGIGGGSGGSVAASNAGGGANVTIYGGKVEAYGANDAAGIGGGYRSSRVDVVIKGGDVYAKGGFDGSGIGTGHHGDSNCTIKISGGHVEAKGGADSAGIGCACDTGSVDIYISGETYGENRTRVEAYGGTADQGMWEGGAGIGGGTAESFKGNIYIYGGDIKADGQHHGAGIGSAQGENFDGYIGISGGSISADGKDYGAGVGAGKGGHFTEKGKFDMTGGELYAASEEGAGIGAGQHGDMSGTIIIRGTAIVTASSTHGAGIGAGREAGAGGGGECKGTVNIGDTARVRAKTENEDACAIGRGDDGSENGTLRLYDTARVTAGDRMGSASLIAYNDRVYGCRKMYAFIENCAHPDRTYSKNDSDADTHRWKCSYCSATGTEGHSWSEKSPYDCIHCGIASHIVTFDMGYIEEIPSQRVAHGGHAVRPEDPEMPEEEIHFDNWYQMVNGQRLDVPFDFSTPVTEDILIEAVYGPEAHGADFYRIETADGAPETDTFISDDTLLEIITQEELDDNYGLLILSSPYDESKVPQEDLRELVYKAMTLGATPETWFDISLYKFKDIWTGEYQDRLAEETTVKLTQTDVPVSLMLKVPASLHKEGRRFYILACHDGEVTVAAQGTATEFSWKTDRFSTYLLAYRDTADSNIPVTGVSSFAGTGLIVILFTVCLTVFAAVRRKERS